MINKILKDVKKTELSAENMMKNAEKNANKVIKNALSKVEELKDKMKIETIQKGEMLIIEDEKRAKEESGNIKENCEKEKAALQKKSLDKIENAVNFIAEKIIEGK
ncbi:MAG: hypothetical protein U9N08_05295 [Candidatus Caldatribacteriota bacterium]|nr:hypothetical protein [Candidatus Caldatribacteriota bacterium]